MQHKKHSFISQKHVKKDKLSVFFEKIIEHMLIKPQKQCYIKFIEFIKD